MKNSTPDALCYSSTSREPDIDALYYLLSFITLAATELQDYLLFIRYYKGLQVFSSMIMALI